MKVKGQRYDDDTSLPRLKSWGKVNKHEAFPMPNNTFDIYQGSNSPNERSDKYKLIEFLSKPHGQIYESGE
jgi:hypothetical protein